MTDAAGLKACCATLYESDLAAFLLGGSLHPGGLPLTGRLGTLLHLTSGKRVLDVASGKGESAFFLAQQFGCKVVGVDYSARNIDESSARATALVSFIRGDAERLPFDDASFDVLFSECAFCTFPDKHRAAMESYRVLKPGGVIGLSDLTRSGPLPAALQGLLAWISCIADALPVSEYHRHLTDCGFIHSASEVHDNSLAQLVADIQGRLLGVELMVKLKKLTLPDTDISAARQMAREAAAAVKSGLLGYALMIARKPL